jgi:hypothetical protein
LPQRQSTRFAECQLSFHNKDSNKEELNFSICEPQLDDLIYQMEEALAALKKMETKNQH